MRTTSLVSQKRDHDNAENKRKNHQDKLHEELNREAREMFLLLQKVEENTRKKGIVSNKMRQITQETFKITFLNDNFVFYQIKF